MSDNIVALTNRKKNEIEFEMEVEGLTVDPASIRFIIETSEMDYAFKCSKKKGKVYSVTVPPLPQLEKTMYPFRIEVVIDGYHFTPMKGQVNVTGSFEVYATDAKNTTVAPPAKKEVKKEVKKDEKDIAGLAQKVLGKKVEPKKVEPKKVEPKKVEPKKVEPKKAKAKAAPKKVAEPKKVASTPNSKEHVKQSTLLKAAKKDEKKAATVKEIANTLDVTSIEADKLVKDAILQLRESKSKMTPGPTPKTETTPFFKKVNSKKEKKVVVEKKATNNAPAATAKEQEIHAILENAQVDNPIEPVVQFTKGKRVKN